MTTTPIITASGAHIFPMLPLEFREKHISEVQNQLEKRWLKVKKMKDSFASYQKKSEEEIREEFGQLHQLRQNLWYRNPKTSPHVCQEDYMIDQALLEKGYYRTINNIAFAYNCVDGSYNASTVLLYNHHFIALMEPLEEIVHLFFKLLINHGASILVRLKPEGEFANAGTINYWKNKITKRQDSDFISLDVSQVNWPVKPVQIPYFYTDAWQDNQGMEVKELYQLVQKVRLSYQNAESKGPIACHCAGGVGRTGTFIAAYILADLLDQSKIDEISIEEIVLKLSMQRPNMVGTVEQYQLLYKFVAYYIEQQQLSL